MEDAAWQVVLVIISVLLTGSYGHFLKDKSNTTNKIADLQSENANLKTRVDVLEKTTVGHEEAKEIAEQIIAPLAEGINEIKGLIKDMSKTVMDIQLEAAKREGMEMANKHKQE